MQRHFQTLIALLDGQSAEAFSIGDSDWQEINKICMDNKLAGFLFSKIPNPSVAAIPKSIRRQWEGEWSAQRLFNAFGFSTLEALECQVPLIRLKGSSLIPRFYPDFGSRHLCDIDILIHESDAKATYAILLGLGFDYYPTLQWEASSYRTTWMLKKESGLSVSVDVHTRLYWNQSSELAIEESTEPGYRRLSDSNELLHLIVNWVEQDTCVSLNKLIDICLYARHLNKSPSWRWSQWWLSAEKLGHGRSVRIVQMLLATYFSTDIRPEEDRSASPNLKAKLLRRLVDPALLCQSTSRPVSYYLLKHLTRNPLWTLKYDWQWLRARLMPPSGSARFVPIQVREAIFEFDQSRKIQCPLGSPIGYVGNDMRGKSL